MRILHPFLLLLILTAISVQKSLAYGTRCASVGPAGDVTLTWENTGLNAADFRAWYIYHSTSASGPFNLIDSVFFFNQTNRIHLTALANNNPAYYFVSFIPLSGNPPVISDTIRTIFINVLNPRTGFANLSWNATHSPLIASQNSWYKIYREYPRGFFTLLDSVDASISAGQMTYSDQISICSDTIKYRIVATDASGCISVSNLDGELFRDLQPPAIPVLDSVSTDINGNGIIGWNVNPSTDTRAYAVLHLVNGIWTILDTVFNRNNTNYLSFVSASNSSQSFNVIAVDSCGNPSSQSVPHSTIFLNVSFSQCERANRLSWNPYTFWGNNVTYDILLSVNGGAEFVIGSTSSTTYSDQNLISGSAYCYRVRAKESFTARSSTSNRACVSPAFPPPPAYSYIRSVSVAGENLVRVEAFVDPAATVRGYDLLRSESQSGPFVRVATILVTGVSSVILTDNTVNTSARPYYYKMLTVDSCGQGILESQVSKTILLSGTANPDYTNSLSWDFYSLWGGGVSHYNIYRRINGVLSASPVAVIYASSAFMFTDTVIDEFYSDGQFCYVIEAVEAFGNPFFFLDSARSNEICLVQAPKIFIPNAFHPGGGLNNIFYPVNGFVDARTYSMSIFNRWGERIFQTNDPRAGWDGSSNGRSSPEGVYIYLLEAEHPDGSSIRIVDSVTLIR
ncbi:MAG: hypothetical protein DWQ44_08340 [Bacteroidetes bacterium]|nr:MAG: hypothetical protein DWQ44_08340 [Bacteroidota bacterium]